MKTFVSSFVKAKNQLEGTDAWAHLVEIVVNANTTARFTSHAETVTWNSNVYQPVPLSIGEEEQVAGNQLPSLQVSVANFQGMAYRFAKDNDLALQDVTIRLVNTTLTASGADDSIRMQILGSVFAGEVAVFHLGFNHNYDSQGPRRTYNRTSFPTIPFNLRQWAII